MPGASEPDLVYTKQQRIAALAQQDPQMGFFSLAHHIDLRWLYEAFLRVRVDGASGVDGQTAQDYAAHLGDNLRYIDAQAPRDDRRELIKNLRFGHLWHSLSP